MHEPKGWYSRGYLPHFDGGEITQMVTFHLADSIPAAVRERWSDELAHLPAGQQEMHRRKRIELYLDTGHGDSLLRDPCLAGIVEGALLFFDGQRYRSHAWAVMPNHTHKLFTPCEGHSLATILHSWKSYTSHKMNQHLGRTGERWFHESYDRFIRNEEHFARAIAYIEHNPVRRG